ncbi:MAG TPA: serine hydrolase [Thiobacillaceae bacterium]|nr:serine hydrolase [Thiobacillaceae bacterium]HNU63767.1 serine hydrolase [Thiobacillaceae bacterium]
MRRFFLYLVLAAFLAAPMVEMPAAEAATPATAKNDKKAKSKVRHRVKSKSKAKSKARAGKKARISQRKVVVPRAITPLRLASTTATPAGEDGLGLRSSAALVVDQRSGEALYAKNEDIPTSIASITKLMTAMVTLDADLPLDEEITISDEDVDRLKGTGSRLPLGARLTRDELLHLALIASENRAAAALSRAYPGGREAFVRAMNRKARSLGMQDSLFVDGTGLNSRNRATAMDLAKMVDAAYRYPLIREISSSGAYDVGLPGKHVVKVREHGKVRRVTREVTRTVAFNNTNALTRNDAWQIGVSKTGYINEAGKCLVMQARIADRPVIIVLLDSWGAWTRIGDANRIRKWLEQGGRMASRTAHNSV